ALADLSPRRELLGDLLVMLGLEVFKREILELPLDLPDPQAVRERRVDVHGLPRGAPLLLGRERRERPHVMEAVAELHDDDPQVVAIARSILRMFSAWCSSRDCPERRDSLVTPSTSRPISSPKSRRTSSVVRSVSSGTSWRSAAATVAESIPSSATSIATAAGCVMYGSPETQPG